MLTLLLLLQIAQPGTEFARHFREAQAALGIRPPVTHVVPSQAPPPDQGQLAAWIQWGRQPDRVYVHADFLRQAHPYIQEVVACHEACHLYLGTNRPYPSASELLLQHLMIDGCIEWLLGSRHDAVMRGIPCGLWYPYEAMRYNQRIGKPRCRVTPR